jgi:hypothetical protein
VTSPSDITPLTLNVPQADLDDLRARFTPTDETALNATAKNQVRMQEQPELLVADTRHGSWMRRRAGTGQLAGDGRRWP